MKSLNLLFALSLIFITRISCNLSKKYIAKQPDPPEIKNSNSQTIENYKSSESLESINDEALLQTLIAVENSWKQAKISGDTNTLNQIFADEFTNTAEDGNTYTKTQWVRFFTNGDSTVKTFNINDAKLIVRTKDTATISFKITTVYNYKKNSISVLNDIDKFVFRDGRWQVISSISKEKK